MVRSDEDEDFAPPPWKRKIAPKAKNAYVAGMNDPEVPAKRLMKAPDEIRNSGFKNKENPAKDIDTNPKSPVCESRVMSAIWNVKSKPVKASCSAQMSCNRTHPAFSDDDFMGSPRIRCEISKIAGKHTQKIKALILNE